MKKKFFVYFRNQENWNELMKICHNWRGRNGQIGFEKCSFISNNFYEYLKSKESLEEKGKNLDKIAFFLNGLQNEFYCLKNYLTQSQLCEHS